MIKDIDMDKLQYKKFDGKKLLVCPSFTTLRRVPYFQGVSKSFSPLFHESVEADLLVIATSL